MSNAALSQKFRVASCVATLMVVLRHSYTIAAFYPAGDYPQWLFSFEWGTLFWTDVAVPFFFFASGFFFMRSDYVANGTYFAMLRKKARTLLLPFVIWNLVGGCVLCVYDSEGNLGDSFASCLHNFFYSQWYGPLWYVRDLMLLMLAFPLYGWLYRRWFQVALVGVILYLMVFRWGPCDIYLLNAEGILFFLLGGLMQHHQGVLAWRSRRALAIILLLVWLAFSFFITSWDRDIHRLSLLVGMPAFWLALDLIPQWVQSICVRLAPYTFLVYVTHFYLLKALKVTLAWLCPGSAEVALATFLILPVVVVAVLVFIGQKWRRLLPRFYSFCVGGR